MPYQDAVRAMQKLREYGLVSYEEQERADGGRRFLYLPITEDSKAFSEFLGKLP